MCMSGYLLFLHNMLSDCLLRLEIRVVRAFQVVLVRQFYRAFFNHKASGAGDASVQVVSVECGNEGAVAVGSWAVHECSEVE